jgi:hypothetical protein
MRKRDRAYHLKRKKLMNTSIFAVLVAVTMVLSTSVTGVDLQGEQEIVNEGLQGRAELDVQMTGLAPGELQLSTGQVPVVQNIAPVGCDEMYGYCAALCPSSEGPVKWAMDEPGTLEQLSTETLPNFAAGGTWTCDERWLVVDYANGALYEIDPEDGAIEIIGGGGSGLNGLAMDPSSQQMYGASSTDLYKVSPEDGEQEFIGSFGIGDSMIGLACSMDGIMYGWDVKFSGDSYIYTIDLETGAATELFSLEKTLLYAQDGDICREDGILWLSAYIYTPEYGGYLCKVDIDAETIDVIGQFESSAEITGSIIQSPCIPPEHDVGIKSIIAPEDGYATPAMDIQALVKNYGNNSETTDVQFEIIKCEAGPPINEANFSGTFPPAGWETDYWRQSSSNNAGGEAPEARVNKYWVAYGRDNYIRTPGQNATGFEKINVWFRQYLNTYSSYGRYVYYYLKYRKNATSPWRDVSPWPNPVMQDLEPKLYEIGCYGWGEDMGSEFQVQWGIQGTYYYYWDDVYLDDYKLEGCAGCAEYADIEEDVEVPFEGEVVVEFEDWTPSEWQNPEFEDTWEDYPLSAFTLMEDENVRNDRKNRLLMLYYPWLHDIGTFDLQGPQDGPAQTFPMTGVIKNVGQYSECCFKTYAEVAEVDFSTSTNIYNYNFGTSCYPFPRDGWTRSDTNWQCTYSSYFGSYSPCLRFYYYPIAYPWTYRFMSPPIDTTGYGAVEIEFDQYQSYNYGTYTMEVETSPDGTSFTTVWDHQGPIGPEHTTILTGENVGGENFRISFAVKTQSYSILYWYIDNIEINGFPLHEAEYSEEICIEELHAGVERELEFDDWTPDFLQYETSGQKIYKVRVWCDLDDPLDRNGANDEYGIFLTLDYFHDAAIQEVSNPYENPSDRRFYATDCTGYPSNSRFVWFDPEDPGNYNDIGKWPNTQFPQGATFVEEDELWVCDTTGNIWKKHPDSAEYESVGSAGTGELVSLAFHEKSGTMYGMSTKNFYEIDMNTGDATLIGGMGNPGLMISCDCNKDGVMFAYELDFSSGDAYTIDLETGDATKLGETGFPCNYGQDMAYDWEEDKMMIAGFNYNQFRPELLEMDMETGAFTFIAALDGSQTTCFAIPGGGLGPDVYVAPGTQSLDVIAANLGTFPERDMSCTAEIQEFITNCTVGTTVYTDLVENIDILTPLVGTKSLNFGSYNFATEGFYGLFLELTDDDDDYPDNNLFAWGIGCDDTPPASSHTLDPPNPDGKAGWYVSDLDVSVVAADPSIGCDIDGSGVKQIHYTVNGVPGTLPGEAGTFTITQNGNNMLVEYWAEDWVGNMEAKHSFTIDMDQTLPNVAARWDAYQVDGDWYVDFTVTATDDMSGMEVVKMYINEGFHKEVVGSGPEYVFTIEWSNDFKTVDFRFEAWDIAGWDDSAIIPGSDINKVPYLKSQSLPKQKTQPLPK